MSKILEKAFDASKKIIRSVFKGSPNLITTSDLNRQFEALKYQVDKLDEKTGFVITGSRTGLTYSLKSSTLNVTASYEGLIFKGCLFSPTKKDLTINLTSSAPYAYLCLVADSEEVTYATDNSHDIAGAKFEDGTSMASANQLRYKNEDYVLVHSYSSVDNLVGVLVKFTLKNENVIIDENTIYDGDSLCFDRGNKIKDLSLSGGSSIGDYPYGVGDSYEDVFKKIRYFLGPGYVTMGTVGSNHTCPDDWNENTMLNNKVYAYSIGRLVFISFRLLGNALIDLFRDHYSDAGIYVLFHQKDFDEEEFRLLHFLGGSATGNINVTYSNSSTGVDAKSTSFGLVMGNALFNKNYNNTCYSASFSVLCEDLNYDKLNQDSKFSEYDEINVMLVYSRALKG